MEKSSLKVSVVQPTLIWHEPETNIATVDKMVNAIEVADLILLPEMWATGYTIKVDKSHQCTEQSLEKMQHWATLHSAVIVGSLIVKETNGFYNRLHFVDHTGVIAYYDKKHLFGLAGEDRYFKAGEERSSVNIGKWTIRPNICYDLRFPVWSRNDDNYDLLIYSACWPDQRIDAWDALLRARAIENQCYVLGANCVGIDAWSNTYSGHSAIINPVGEILSTSKGETVIAGEISKTAIDEIRKKLPFLKDASSFEIVG